jgi:hypothetical protein
MGPGLWPPWQGSRNVAMETAEKKGLTPIQKQMLFQMFLVMAVGLVVTSLLHQPRLMVTFLILGWMLAVVVHARVAIRVLEHRAPGSRHGSDDVPDLGDRHALGIPLT